MTSEEKITSPSSPLTRDDILDLQELLSSLGKDKLDQVDILGQFKKLELVLIPYQVASSIKIANFLVDKKLLSEEEKEQYFDDIKGLKERIKSDKLDVPSYLNEKIVPLNSKLNITYSEYRALVASLFIRDKLLDSLTLLSELNEVILFLSKKNAEVVMPSYSDMQPTDLKLFSSWWLANLNRFFRDFIRLSDCINRVNYCPVSFESMGLDELSDEFAQSFGFIGQIENKINALSDFDSIFEITSNACLIGMHMSQLIQELRVWSTSEFGYVRIPRTVVYKGIEIKKTSINVFSVLKTKCSKLSGLMTEILQKSSGLPVSHTKDHNEFAPLAYSVFNHLEFILDFSKVVLPAMIFDTARMEARSKIDLKNTRAVMDYLIEKDYEFEQAAKIMERLMTYTKDRKKSFQDLTMGEWREFSPGFDNEIYTYLTGDIHTTTSIPFDLIYSMEKLQGEIESLTEKLNSNKEKMTRLPAKFLNNPIGKIPFSI